MVNFTELNDAELNDADVHDGANTEQNELLVVAEEPTDAAAPMRHFHRAVKPRTLSSGPLANPRRTRLV